MRFAYNARGERVFAEDADKKGVYTCPMCGSDVVLKQGRIKIHHFAHKTLEDCEASSGEMTEWHCSWQDRFPKECRGVVAKIDGIAKRHVADVMIGDVVIEFQHSPMDFETWYERTLFYRAMGKEVIWLFDLSDKDQETYKAPYNSNTTCVHVKRMNAVLKEIFYYGGLVAKNIYVQLAKTDEIARVDDLHNGSDIEYYQLSNNDFVSECYAMHKSKERMDAIRETLEKDETMRMLFDSGLVEHVVYNAYTTAIIADIKKAESNLEFWKAIYNLYCVLKQDFLGMTFDICDTSDERYTRLNDVREKIKAIWYPKKQHIV